MQLHLKQGMSSRTMPKWGHWFWITTLIVVGFAGSAFAIGRGGLEPHHPPGFPPHPDGVPLPFPVFIRPPEILSDERLTIVTPSSVVKNPELSTKTVSVTSSVGPVTSSVGGSDRRSSGFARKLEEGPEKEEVYQGTPNTEQPDPSDVSVSQSVSVVSVKYSLSGERRRQQLNESRQQQLQQHQQQQHESRQLPDTSLPPPSPPQTTAPTTARIVTTAPASKRETQSVQSSSTTTTTSELPFDDTTMSSTHSQPQRKQMSNISPSTTLLSSSSTTTTTTALPFKQPSHSEIESKTTTTTTALPTTTTTMRSSSSHHQKENDPLLAFSISPSTKITASTTTTTTTATTTTTSSPFDSSTKKLVPINHSLNRENFEVTTRSNVRTVATSQIGGRPQNEEEETDHEFKEEEKVDSANADLATSTVRGEKALFTSFEMVKQQNRNHFQTILNSTIGASIASTTSAATSRHTTTSRPTTTATTTTTTTTSTTAKARLLTTTTAPQKIYLQEVEEITDIDEDEIRNSTTAAMESKALHSNVPPPRQLTSDDKVGVLQKTSQANLETTEATKMVVEYLEEAELARSFPSTKWNVYEDQDGTWYLQKTSTRSSPKPESPNSESPVEKNSNNNRTSDAYIEYEEVPRVVDVGESGLNLPDLGDSDRDEEPYEKFMAEESGRSSSIAATNDSNMNDEYFDTKDDELTPNYDEKNYTDDVDTSPIEPRMLSTAQKPVESRVHHRREEDVIDEWGQPKVRKPPAIDVATVVGITVGAFLFILIGTVGLGAFIYHEKYMNKPHTLEDRFSSSDSDGSSVEDPYRRISQIDCVGFDTTRDTFCEEMYNLDNDSFLNSLETVNVPSSYWIHEARNCDSDV